MSVIQWAEPVTNTKERIRLDADLVATLRKRPGRWALVAYRAPHATNVYTFARKYGLQATARGSRATGFDIYVRAI